MSRRNFLKFTCASAVAFALSPLFKAFAAEPIKTYEGFVHPALASNSTEPVDVQLVLAMDTSGSMTEEEWNLELEATAQAINSSLFRQVIKGNPELIGGEIVNKSAAIAVVDYGTKSFIRIPWVDVRADEINNQPFDIGVDKDSWRGDGASDSADKLDLLAAEILSLRKRSGGTSPHTAMEKARLLYNNCPWPPIKKRILDVFGDGDPKSKASLEDERDRMASMGVTVNGFAIVNEESDLVEKFKEDLVTQRVTRGPSININLRGEFRRVTLTSQRGLVWAVARNMKAHNNDDGVLRDFAKTVREGMKQKIAVEVAGIDTYHDIMKAMGQVPHKPVPEPVPMQAQNNPLTRFLHKKSMTA